MKKTVEAKRTKSDESSPTKSTRSIADDLTSDLDLRGDIFDDNDSSRKVVMNHFFPHTHNNNSSNSNNSPGTATKNNRVKFANSSMTVGEKKTQSRNFDAVAQHLPLIKTSYRLSALKDLKPEQKQEEANFDELESDMLENDGSEQPSNLNRLVKMASYWNHRLSGSSAITDETTRIRRHSSNKQQVFSKHPSSSSHHRLPVNDPRRLPSIEKSDTTIRAQTTKVLKSQKTKLPLIETNRLSLPSYEMSPLVPSARRKSIAAAVNAKNLTIRNFMSTTANSNSTTYRWYELGHSGALETHS